MSGIRLYFRYLGVSIRSQMQYRASFVMLAVGHFLVTGSEVLGIWALFSRFGSLRGWRLAEVALFYGLIHVAFAIADAVGRGFDLFPGMVKSGDFDRLLLRPRSTALQVGSRELTLMRVGRLAQGLLVLLWASAALDLHWSVGRVALAVFAVVRFRNVLKDTRDTVFILWTIVQGMAVGTMRFSTAVMGCLIVAFVFLYLRFTSFGSRHRYDVVLSLHWTGGPDTLASLRPILRRHAVRSKLASQRSSGDEGMDLSYRILLRDPGRSRELITELQKTAGVAHASLYHKEDESEI